MGYLDSLFSPDPTTEKTVTFKTKPTKKDGPPEAPIDPASANLPQPVLDLIRGMGMQDFQAGMRGMSETDIPRETGIGGNSLLQMIIQGLQGGGQIPAGMIPAAPNPMDGQTPMDFSVVPGFNPYGQ